MQKINKVLYSLTWIINLFLVAAVFASFTKTDFWTYYNSDTLYLGSIYKDIFIDGTGFQGWYLNAAPNFFPDMFLYFIINTLFEDFRTAYIVFSFVQYFIILILLNVLLKSVNPTIKSVYLIFLNLIFPVFLLVTLLSDNFTYTYYLFSHSFHTGVFINFLLAAVFLFKYIDSKKNIFIWSAVVISFIGTYSDRLFLVLFTFPMICVYLINFIRIKNQQLKIIGTGIILSSIAALILFKFTSINSVFHCIGLNNKFMNFDNILVSFNNLLNQHFIYIKELKVEGFISVITLLNIIIIPVLIFRNYKRYRQSGNTDTFLIMETFWFALIFCSVFITLISPVINGYYLGEAHLRFNIFSFWISVFNIVFFLYTIIKYRHKYIYVVSCILFIFYTAFLIKDFTEKDVFSNINKIAAFYPERVKRIDDFAERKNLKFGLSRYFSAKYVTMFSKKDLRVYSISNEKLKPWFHVMNKNWYFDHTKGKYNKPVFNFILTDKYDKSKLTANFGEPIDSMVHDGEIVLYIMNDIKFNPKNNEAYLTGH